MSDVEPQADLGPTYDLVVLGGGITGAGIARDAASRGLRVALFEKGDFGSGTSSKSSKLVHGGLRYLEHGELALVFESVSERRRQMEVAPHLVRPQPFLVPIYKGVRPGLELMNIGLWIYDALALFRAPKMHRTYRGTAAALTLEPKLKAPGLRGVLEYYDCATDDARLVLENIVDAVALGAACHNYTQVTRLERDAAGAVRGVDVEDRLTGARRHVRCHALVVAAGAWTDETLARLAVPTAHPLLRRTKGVHIVVPADRLPLDRAITLISPVDGRVMFAIPWRGRTVLGTTDTDYTGTADAVAADAEDVRYLCASINGYFPSAHLVPADVIATWAGLRPLIAGPPDADESAVSREHEVFARPDRVVIIAGGKLTTYRRMAGECVDAALDLLADLDGDAAPRARASTTKTRPLPGAAGLGSADLEGVAVVGRALRAAGIDDEVALHLCGVYGARAPQLVEMAHQVQDGLTRIDPELPYVWAEIDFALRCDYARTVEDLLARRVPLLLVARDQGLGVAAAVARRAAVTCGWSADTEAEHLASYVAEVELSRAWQAELAVDANANAGPATVTG